MCLKSERYSYVNIPRSTCSMSRSLNPIGNRKTSLRVSAFEVQPACQLLAKRPNAPFIQLQLIQLMHFHSFNIPGSCIFLKYIFIHVNNVNTLVYTLNQ